MKVFNRKFNREYQSLEKYEAGIQLTGAEVKSVKAGHIRLDDSFVRVLGSEAYLINAHIQVYEYARGQNYDDKRTRKLLLHKKEILKIKTKIKSGSGLTVAPVSCYNKHGIVKLEVALVRARKDIEKRKLEKKRDRAMEEKREAKEYLKS